MVHEQFQSANQVKLNTVCSQYFISKLQIYMKSFVTDLYPKWNKRSTLQNKPPKGFTWHGLQKLQTGAQCISGVFCLKFSSTMYRTNSLKVGMKPAGNFFPLGILTLRYLCVIVRLILSWKVPGNAPQILSLQADTKRSKGFLKNDLLKMNI